MTTLAPTIDCNPRKFLAYDDVTLAANAEELMTPREIANARDVWLFMRRSGIGGSDAAAVMGVGRGGSNALSVWLDKKGRIEDRTPTNQMEWGTRAEAAAAEWWADRHGMNIAPAGLYRSLHWPHVMSTPDRLASCGGTLEVKVQSQFMLKSYGTDDAPVIPIYYLWQIIMQLATTGADHGHLAAMVGQTPVDRVISRDDPRIGGDEGIAEKMELLEAWWTEYVEGNVAPANDPTVVADLDQLGAHERVQAAIPFLTLSDRMRDEEIGEEIKALEEEQAAIRERADAEIGSAKYLMVDDYAAFVKVRSTTGRKRLSLDKIKERLAPWQIGQIYDYLPPAKPYIKRAGKAS